MGYTCRPSRCLIGYLRAFLFAVLSVLDEYELPPDVEPELPELVDEPVEERDADVELRSSSD